MLRSVTFDFDARRPICPAFRLSSQFGWSEDFSIFEVHRMWQFEMCVVTQSARRKGGRLLILICTFAPNLGMITIWRLWMEEG